MPTTYTDLITQRERFSNETASALQRNVKLLQSALYSLVVDKILNKLETDESGAIKFTVANVNKAGNLKSIWSAHQKATNSLTKWIIGKLIDLFDLNTVYMREVASVTDSLEARSRKLLLLNIGYDIDKKTIVPGSWLENLSAQAEVKQRVTNRISTAIQSKISLKDFRAQFKNDFLDTKTGLGYLSRYYEQRAFNIFQKFDRASQQVYAEQLKLDFRIYSGTLMEPVKGKTKGTRPFCRQRLNNIYSSGEIEKWRNLKFSGRVDPYDPFLDCGSINCRHHWSVISNEMKEALVRRGRKVDEYNPLPDYLKGKE